MLSERNYLKSCIICLSMIKTKNVNKIKSQQKQLN